MKRQLLILSGIFFAALSPVHAEESSFVNDDELMLELDSELSLSPNQVIEREKKELSKLDVDFEGDEDFELGQKAERALVNGLDDADDDALELMADLPKMDEPVAKTPQVKTRENETMVVRADKPAAALSSTAPAHQIQISFAQVFAGSPIIYSILLTLSVFSLCICLYNLIGVRSASDSFVNKIRQKLMSNQFDEALTLCLKNDQLFGRVIGAGISARKQGIAQALENMKAEGKRATVGFWQRIAILNDIAIIAPMLGLLGTVLGMFYAFYDLNRSRESVNTLFDGLGISVGTTVAGLVVAIVAMMLHSLAKYKLVRTLAHIEDEAQSMAALMEARMSSSSTNTLNG